MEELAKQWNAGVADIIVATVKSILEGKYFLADQYGRVTHARRAVSCLLNPEVGDRVLVVNTGDTSYLWAVLEHPHEDTSLAISLEGDVTMSLPNGKLEITAKEGINLGTPEDLSLVASRLGFSGEALSAAFQKIDLFGDAVEARLSNIKLFSKRLRSTVDSAVQHFVKRHINVDGIDMIKAGTIKQTAKDLLSLRSAFAFMKAKKNVKIDGKQIFMG